MAMGVNDYVGGLGAELQSRRFIAQEFLNKLLEEEAAAGHLLSAGQLQLQVVLDEHGITRRFEEKYGGIVRVPIEQGEVVEAQPCGPREVTLAERGPTAAPPT